MKTSMKLILALSCVFAAGGAFAADSPDAMESTVTVRYGDLNLARSEGAEALYARLRGAARKVCGTSDIRDLVASNFTKLCYERALSKAVQKIDQASLAALFGSRPTA